MMAVKGGCLEISPLSEWDRRRLYVVLDWRPLSSYSPLSEIEIDESLQWPTNTGVGARDGL